MVLPADRLADFIHVMLNESRGFLIELVDRFPALEINVRIFLAVLHRRPFRIERPLPEIVEVLRLEQAGQGLIIDDVDFFDDVGRPESVEEMKKRNPGPESRKVGDDGQVLGFLDRAGAGHGEAGVAGRHDVAVIAEDRERLAGQGAGRDQEDRGEHLPGDLVHVREHEHQALGGGERRRQGAGRKGPVDRARGAPFRLHFDHVHRLAEDVLLALGRPFIGQLAHRRGGRDRINGGDFGIRVGNMGRGRVSVDRFEVFLHEPSSFAAARKRRFRL